MDGQVRRYEGAAAGRRHASWMAKANPSVNQLINKDHKTLVGRARDLAINNPYAKKAPVSIANNVVGTGIIPTPKVVQVVKDGKVVAAGISEQTEKLLAAAWKEWAENLSCDYDGDFNFYGLQYIAMRTIATSGEILAIRKRVKTDVNKFGFQIKLLEGDYIDTSKHSDKDSGGGYTLYGVKFDAQNKRSGYYIFDRHPSDGSAQSSFVKIEDIIHVYDVERVGQTRGVPFAASTLLKQRDLDDYEDAELLGKKVQSCMPIFVTKNDVDPDNASEEENIESLEPGQINYLRNGESVTLGSTPVSAGFTDFTRTQHRAIANGYGLTYENFTGDLSNVNFSSGRMGALEFAKTVEYWQYLMFIPHFCDKAFTWFVEGAKIAAGINKDLVIKCLWTAPRREMIDPMKEISAQRLNVRSGFTTWQNVVKENGYNPEDILADLKAANKMFKDAGLIVESDPATEVALKQPAPVKNEAGNAQSKEGK
ncbi:phage portal protein [Foetidibacter luteolus]|uniref:phage portal protein n=1 Tax=Foetidibacter luteolus TaxID=2608880 RepID=UPI0021CE24AB|nr:phage portal protein [Foetidibacter luteolus]